MNRASPISRRVSTGSVFEPNEKHEKQQAAFPNAPKQGGVV